MTVVGISCWPRVASENSVICSHVSYMSAVGNKADQGSSNSWTSYLSQTQPQLDQSRQVWSPEIGGWGRMIMRKRR